MGQLPAKESSTSSRNPDSSNSTASTSHGVTHSHSHSQFSSFINKQPQLPPLNLPSSFDGGKFEPQGIYPTAAQDYNHRIVHESILKRRLAPFYKGSDDQDTYEESEENTECPICFLVSIFDDSEFNQCKSTTMESGRIRFSFKMHSKSPG